MELEANAQLVAVSFSYPQRTVVEGLSCVIPAGVTWLGGDECSGKTTVLRLLAGELSPISGAIWHASNADNAALQPSVVFMDPKSEQFDALTVPQFLEAMQARFAQLDRDHWFAMAHSLGLSDHLEKSVYMLSTGSKRKLFLVTALCAGAALTLLDEPFAALDLASVRKVQEVLQTWCGATHRACVVADYQPPANVALAHTILLPA